MTRLRFGKALRAAAENPAAAASVGGILVGLAFSMAPASGLAWLLRGFTVIVLGGMGSIWGSFFGGVIVGIAEEFGAVRIGPQYRDLVVFSLLVIILVVRPQGLLGRKLT